MLAGKGSSRLFSLRVLVIPLRGKRWVDAGRPEKNGCVGVRWCGLSRRACNCFFNGAFPREAEGNILKIWVQAFGFDGWSPLTVFRGRTLVGMASTCPRCIWSRSVYRVSFWRLVGHAWSLSRPSGSDSLP